MSFTETPYGALMFDELEDYEFVIAELTKHIQSGLPSGPALHNRAIARWEIGQYEEASRDFDLAFMQLPHSHMHLQMKGAMLQKLGRLEEALQALDRAIDIAPNEVTVVRTRAYARMEAGRLQEALADLDHAVELEPGFQYAREVRDKLVKQIGRSSGGSNA